MAPIKINIKIINEVYRKTETIATDEGGNVFMRGVNAMCAKAQQALLDSHRAGVTDVVGRNLIEDLMQGSTVTLLSISQEKETLLPQGPSLKWKAAQDGEVVAIVDTKSAKFLDLGKFRSISSPAALSLLGRSCATAGLSEREVTMEWVLRCERAVLISCFQSEVTLSKEEARALSWMLSYDPGGHDLPVTNKVGAMARGLRPFVTMLATHFGVFHDLAYQGAFETYSEVETLSENLAMGDHPVGTTFVLTNPGLYSDTDTSPRSQALWLHLTTKCGKTIVHGGELVENWIHGVGVCRCWVYVGGLEHTMIVAVANFSWAAASRLDGTTDNIITYITATLPLTLNPNTPHPLPPLSCHRYSPPNSDSYLIRFCSNLLNSRLFSSRCMYLQVNVTNYCRSRNLSMSLLASITPVMPPSPASLRSLSNSCLTEVHIYSALTLLRRCLGAPSHATVTVSPDARAASDKATSSALPIRVPMTRILTCLGVSAIASHIENKNKFSKRVIIEFIFVEFSLNFLGIIWGRRCGTPSVNLIFLIFIIFPVFHTCHHVLSCMALPSLWSQPSQGKQPLNCNAKDIQIILKHLNMNPNFIYYIFCPKCYTLYPLETCQTQCLYKTTS
ncbi:hypothetical protein VP01_1022g2 [Puccinia sorghi]|uniref:Uncharacterized protein n=1 Tax=Puccinia sorghi TaxID=27349 RepID=A0A0L6VUU6_9BASI|nr:hypothetical protein VP01_1022g2 [Puccinia sorghi]